MTRTVLCSTIKLMTETSGLEYRVMAGPNLNGETRYRPECRTLSAHHLWRPLTGYSYPTLELAIEHIEESKKRMAISRQPWEQVWP